MSRKTADEWFEEYGESHRNPVNKLIHWVCVPVIYLTIFGLLWDAPQPSWMSETSYLNWAVLASIPVLVFYWQLSSTLYLGLAAFHMICISLLAAYEIYFSTPLWMSSLILFVIAWAGQFLGHKIEGKKPSFFKDIQFLLIGPAWLMGFIYKKLQISYD